ncbi:hypothetical protein B0H11DRAFT_2006824 [Mycena galericulata]|nr:hypothetical protein B0H11DRAFT_2006824 [Mycena galericulata]
MGKTPLDVQELLDHCIGFLADSPADLCACALISRAWVHASQSRLFAAVSLHGRNETSMERVLELLEVWDASPHLVRHTTRLSMNLSEIDTAHFMRICHVPFIRLSSLELSGSVSDPKTSASIQRLLSLQNLRSVKLMCYFERRVFAQEIWVHASPSIEHVVLGGFLGDDAYDTQGTVPEPPHTSRLKLKSFHIFTADPSQWWFQDEDYFPFDISALKSFTYFGGPSLVQIVRSRAFAPALRTIEILTLFAFLGSPPDLRDFSRLRHLDVQVPDNVDTLLLVAALQMLSPNNFIETLAIRASERRPITTETWHRLDEAMSAEQMPSLKIVYIHPWTSSPATASERFFPVLTERKVIPRLDAHPHWHWTQPETWPYELMCA